MRDSTVDLENSGWAAWNLFLLCFISNDFEVLIR